MDSEKKCDKYESIFVFQGEDALLEHLKDCPDCKKEHEKYLKISNLVKEVAPEYMHRQEKQKTNALRRLACCFVLFVGITASFTGYSIYEENAFQVNSVEESYISSMGLPTDEYGFLEL